jgi:thioesterase domain-containing protein
MEKSTLDVNAASSLMPTPLKYSMPIKTRGDSPPLFCIHGEPLKIAMRQKVDRPVYGVNFSYFRFRRSDLPETIEEYAALYLADIRAIQSRGPYYIVGYSVGGMIAYEIARQLLDAGEQIGHLTLVEPTNPDVVSTPLAILRHNVARSKSKMSALLMYMRKLPGALWPRFKTLVQRLRTRMHLRLNIPFPQSLAMAGLTMAIAPVKLRYEYRPITIGGSLVYRSLDDASIKLCHEYWNEKLTDGIEVFSIANVRKHLDLMEEPALGQMVGILDRSVQPRP